MKSWRGMTLADTIGAVSNPATVVMISIELTGIQLNQKQTGFTDMLTHIDKPNHMIIPVTMNEKMK